MPIWLKRINRFINYYWWSEVNFIRDDNGGTSMSQDPFQEREAEKYANPIPSREFILEHLTKREKPASREDGARRTT
ncbi:3'-to-5' exoribonuclease RNase R, partial [Salmonella enterica subsp. enterica serovar Alachua str. R6-377]